jgi:hypothetical protein
MEKSPCDSIASTVSRKKCKNGKLLNTKTLKTKPDSKRDSLHISKSKNKDSKDAKVSELDSSLSDAAKVAGSSSADILDEIKLPSFGSATSPVAGMLDSTGAIAVNLSLSGESDQKASEEGMLTPGSTRRSSIEENDFCLGDDREEW